MYEDTRADYAKLRAGVITSGISVGDPATITYGFPHAGVVTRVTAKTITVARVETGPAEPDMACDVGAYGARPMRSEGILDKIIPGTERRFSRNGRTGRWQNGDTVATLGRSVTWIDYRT